MDGRLVEVAQDATPPLQTDNNTLFQTNGVGNLALRAIALGLFIILGFVGNCVLVGTIAQSTRLRNSILNLFIISMAITNLLDCIVNLPLILGATITEKWDYGSFVCHVNAFGLQLTSICMITCLCLMSLDRMLAVLGKRRLTPLKANLLIVYSWIHSAALSFPLLFKLDTIPVHEYHARYLCALWRNASIAYICLTSVFGYVLPSLLAITFFIVIIKLGVQEKLRERRQATPNAYVEGEMEEPQIWIEINISKYVGVLFILWCLFQGPYLMISTVEQYKNAKDVPDENKEALDFNYPWQVELAFTWMKLCYPIFLPLVTFVWRKDMWQKLKKLVLCHKSNLIVDGTGPGSSSPDRRAADSVPIDTSRTSSVPVLFATEDGLHFQTFTKNDKMIEERVDQVGYVEKKTENGTLVLTARKCDVFGSQDLLQTGEDTSDYDSSGEIDPFSNSNPVSVRSDYSRQQSNKSTSSNNDKDEQKPAEKENAEMGINSKERKKKKRQRRTQLENYEEAATEVVDDNSLEQPSGRAARTTSNGSGQASIEGGSLKSQKAKRKDDMQSRISEVVTETEKLSRGSRKDLEEKGDTCENTEQFGIEEETGNRSPRPLKKRRKKRKLPVRELTGDAIEMQVTKEKAGESLEEPRSLPIPPPRLKPIEQKKAPQAAELYSGSDSFGLQAELTKIHLTGKKHLRQVSAEPQADSCDQGQGSNLEWDSKPRCKSDSNTLQGDERKSPTQFTLKEARSKSGTSNSRTAETSSRSSHPKKDKHQRKSTSDSQTNLLGDSNTSTDLSELGDIANPSPAVAGETGPRIKLKRPKRKTDEGPLANKTGSQQDLLRDTSPR